MSSGRRKPDIRPWPVDRSRVYDWAHLFLLKYESQGNGPAHAYLKQFVPTQFHGQILNLASRALAKKKALKRKKKQEKKDGNKD